MTNREIEALLAEQVSYYRARAAEYDEWWYRTGPYDEGPEANAKFKEEAIEIDRAVAQFEARGDVLELASGTGLWSVQLARTATTLTCVDSAPEMIRINQSKFNALGLQPPHYLETDIFKWHSSALYDSIFFGFWISHVPIALFENFCDKLRRALKPNGRVFFVDERPSDLYVYETPQDEKQLRKLKDGRTFNIVKLYYQPRVLSDQLSKLGWKTDIRATKARFLYGTAWR